MLILAVKLGGELGVTIERDMHRKNKGREEVEKQKDREGREK